MSVIEAPEGLIFKNTRLPVSLHRLLAQAAKESCRSLEQRDDLQVAGIAEG